MIRRASTAAELLVPNYGVPSRVTIIYGGRGDDDDEEEEGGDDDYEEVEGGDDDDV